MEALSLPHGVRHGMVQASVAAVRSVQLGLGLSNPGLNPVAQGRVDALRRLVRRDSLRLHFSEEDVGFVYRDGLTTAAFAPATAFDGVGAPHSCSLVSLALYAGSV